MGRATARRERAETYQREERQDSLHGADQCNVRTNSSSLRVKAVPCRPGDAFHCVHMEVPPMLRLLLHSQPATKTPEPVVTPPTFAVGRLPIINSAVRARLAAAARQRPKSICTSLKDLCEL